MPTSSEKLAPSPAPTDAKFRLVIHGGAGTMDKSRATPELRKQYKAALRHALLAGYAVLSAGGEAMDAAVAAVSSMEDCPLFNAGKGAVFNVGGKNELEASLMLSKPPASHPHIPPERRGSRVRSTSRPTPPRTPCSPGSREDLGKPLGIKLVDPSYYFTENRWREHRRGLGLPEEPLPHAETHDFAWDADLPLEENANKQVPDALLPNPKGTVGAVALDVRGCIAAVTSTGGRTNKLVGRVGDTPSMGCGFWVEEWEVDGWARKIWRRMRGGEAPWPWYFIRLATGATIGRRMKYLNEPLDVAAKACVEELRRDGGVGGIIAMDNTGNITMPLNCSGMYRGFVLEDGTPKTAIFDDDELN
ncbi:asparaginase [Epithele typhae]|uniref:asparaginase n=1 Tax=Epithele typhae TaxID=378194 RepID=UPI002008668A|nr:asparaginase [Epithele typhae]KAH9913470.1 asparaginase [Epithele typhae]